jgi:hypothetical protein
MPSIQKRSPRIRLEFVATEKHSTVGGLPAIEALCQEFGLWGKLRALPGLDPRQRQSHGFAPEVHVAQLLYSLCSGGSSLADAERLNEEPLVRQLARVKAFADQTTLGEWLRKQTPESIGAFWGLVREFIQWVIGRAPAGRWTYGGRAEVFFDDTELEVHGPSFEGAKINYNGERALSWQTLWVGPFLAEGELDSPGEVSRALPLLLERNQVLWTGRESDFLADSGSSAAKYLQVVVAQKFTHWSVSYNKWTKALERTAVGQPESVWGPAREATWRDGAQITEQHCRIRHTPEGSEQTFTFAVVRFKRSDEMFWNYRFLACDEARTDAAGVFARHRLKGEKEQMFKEVLRGLDLHHPPCAELNANRMFYAIGALAYNLMIAVKLLCLPEECQGWQLKTLMRQIVRLPAVLVAHARRLIARVEVPGAWLVWWTRWEDRWWPQAQAGRPAG